METRLVEVVPRLQVVVASNRTPLQTKAPLPQTLPMRVQPTHSTSKPIHCFSLPQLQYCLIIGQNWWYSYYFLMGLYSLARNKLLFRKLSDSLLKHDSPTFSSSSNISEESSLCDLNVLSSKLISETAQDSNSSSHLSEFIKATSSSFDESEGSESWAKKSEETNCNPRTRKPELDPWTNNWVWSWWLKSFFSLNEDEEFCYRCRMNNNHHYLQVCS